jgi:hypothetical protein
MLPPDIRPLKRIPPAPPDRTFNHRGCGAQHWHAVASELSSLGEHGAVGRKHIFADAWMQSFVHALSMHAGPGGTFLAPESSTDPAGRPGPKNETP